MALTMSEIYPEASGMIAVRRPASGSPRPSTASREQGCGRGPLGGDVALRKRDSQVGPAKIFR
jgi:hypothetical protein